jgi:hypothetical protein
VHRSETAEIERLRQSKPVLGTPVGQGRAIQVNLREVREAISHDPAITPLPQAITETEGCTGFDRGQLRTDLAALMAPVGTTEMLPDATGNLVSTPTPASNVVEMRNNTGHTITISPHIPPFGSQPADTTSRLTIDPRTIPTDGNYHQVTLTGVAATDINRPVLIEVFDNTTSQNLGDILQVDVKLWHRWSLDYFAVSELNGRLQPTAPDQATLQAELDRTLRPEANLGFTLKNVGALQDHYDKNGDSKLHIPHLNHSRCALGWTDTINGTAFQENSACTDDTELTPMYQRLINQQRAGSQGMPIDIDNPDMFYLLYFQQFDEDGIGGLSDPRLDHRRWPAIVHTNYIPDLPNQLDHNRFVAVAAIHEIGHKLGQFEHHEITEPNAATYLMVTTFKVRSQTVQTETDASRYPCRLSRKDWNRMNYVYPTSR